MQNLCGKTFFLAQQAEEQMLGPNMLVAEAFSFFGCVSQHPFAWVADGKVDRGGSSLANRRVAFDLFSDGLDGSVGPQEPVRQRFVFAEQTQEEMLGLDVGEPNCEAS
jgi:hypothetical protein